MSTVKQLENQGYRIVSRSGRQAARIDREDWEDFMLIENGFINADFYRRCHSKDVIIISHKVLRTMKNSQHSTVGFKPLLKNHEHKNTSGKVPKIKA